MRIIKGVLKEELENSLKMKKDYEQVLEDLPRGCLIAKEIRGHKYYYLAAREDSKVKYVYKGKVSDDYIKKICRSKKDEGEVSQSSVSN